MTRKIKFRAFDGAKMYYFDDDARYGQYTLEFSDIAGWNVRSLQTDFWICGEYSSVAELSILMQFTGLKDQHGKEIYEGDIVERKDGITGIVSFEIQAGCWWIKWKDTANRYHELSDDAQQGGDYIILVGTEIIGNIHQNPELIKT